MQLTSDDIRQLIKEELDKLLKESSKKEKIPKAVPEDWSERTKDWEQWEAEWEFEKRKKYSTWWGDEDPRYNMGPCPEWIKNRYDYYAEQLKELQRFSAWKKFRWKGWPTYELNLENHQEKKDSTVYVAARIYGCQWAKDLLKKWPDEKFHKFINRIAGKGHFLAKEAGMPWDSKMNLWIEKNFDPDLPRWGLPEAEWQDRREEATGGDEEAPIREVIEDLDARFRERMARDPNWRNEFLQYYDLLDNNRFEEFFFALDNQVGQEIFSYMLVSMGDELQEKLQEVTSFMKENYPTLYKLLQGLEYL